MTGGDNKSNNKTRQSEENEWRLNELTNYGRTRWKRQGNLMLNDGLGDEEYMEKQGKP